MTETPDEFNLVREELAIALASSLAKFRVVQCQPGQGSAPQIETKTGPSMKRPTRPDVFATHRIFPLLWFRALPLQRLPLLHA